MLEMNRSLISGTDQRDRGLDGERICGTEGPDPCLEIQKTVPRWRMALHYYHQKRSKVSI